MYLCVELVEDRVYLYRAGFLVDNGMSNFFSKVEELLPTDPSAFFITGLFESG